MEIVTGTTSREPKSTTEARRHGGGSSLKSPIHIADNEVCFEPRRTLSSHVCADRPDSGLDPSYSSPCPRFSVVGFSCRLEPKPVFVLVRRSAAILLLLFPMSSWAQRSYAAPPPPDQVESEKFAAEVTSFLGKELAAHVADIHALDPPQERVEGALTT